MSARREVIPPAYRKSGRGERAKNQRAKTNARQIVSSEAIFDSHAWGDLARTFVPQVGASVRFD
jgi:hypothetical protein